MGQFPLPPRSLTPPAPWPAERPLAYLEDAALAADARRPVLVLRLDGLGAVDHVGALDHELSCGLHRDNLGARGWQEVSGVPRTGWAKPTSVPGEPAPLPARHSPMRSRLGQRQTARARGARTPEKRAVAPPPLRPSLRPRAGGGALAAGGGRAPTLGSGSRPFGPKPASLSGSWPVGQINLGSRPRP